MIDCHYPTSVRKGGLSSSGRCEVQSAVDIRAGLLRRLAAWLFDARPASDLPASADDLAIVRDLIGSIEVLETLPDPRHSRARV